MAIRTRRCKTRRRHLNSRTRNCACLHKRRLQHPEHEDIPRCRSPGNGRRRPRRAPVRTPRKAALGPSTPDGAQADEKPDAVRPPRNFFQPGEVRSSGTVTIAGQPSPMTLSPAPWSCTPRNGRTPTRSRRTRRLRQVRRQGQECAQARSVDVLHRLFQAGRAGAGPADHFPVQWRAGLSTCGCTWARSGRDACRRSTPRIRRRRLIRSSTTTTACSTSATSCSSTRPAPGFQPHRRQGQGEGVLRRRPGRARLRRFHHPVPDQIRPLELAQISVRRKLRDDARRRLTLSLQNADVDLNGVILLSDILNWDFMPDDPQFNPGRRHALHRRPADLCGDGLVSQQGAEPAGRSRAFLDEVEQFATGDYAQALIRGIRCPTRAAAGSRQQLSAYTGLPVAIC